MNRYSSGLIDSIIQSNHSQLDIVYTKLMNESQIGVVPRYPEAATRATEIFTRAKEAGGATLALLEEFVCETQAKPVPTYNLYMSCSEADREDKYCENFFNVLTKKLYPGDEHAKKCIRYFDLGNPEQPDAWSPWSLRAMQECQVLVCLCSKKYFNSLYCGQVWSAFLNRTRNNFKENDPPPQLIFPVRWIPIDEDQYVPPRVVRELNFAHKDFGELYYEKGLRYLIQLYEAGREKKEYLTFLEKFSERIADSIKKYRLPVDNTIPALQDIKTEFYKSVEDNQAEEQKGADCAKFVFVAAKSDEISALRRSDSYGNDSKDWRPYHPVCRKSVGQVSLRAAEDAEVDEELIPLDKDFIKNIRSAVDKENIILVLVDPWSIRLPEYTKYMKEYDAADVRNCTVFVCWNNNDRETRDVSRALWASIEMVFRTKLKSARIDRFRDRVETVSQLHQELLDAIFKVREEIKNRAENPRKATGLHFNKPECIGSEQAHEVKGVDTGQTIESDRQGVAHVPQPRIGVR